MTDQKGVRFAHPDEFVVTMGENGQPLNPRGVVRDTSDLQESIREGGIVEPILVYRAPDGRLFIRNGHRRVTAAKAVGLTAVPYVEVSGETDGALDALDIMLASNVHQSFPAIVLDKSGVVIGGVAYAVSAKLNEQRAGQRRTRESLARLMGVRPDLVSAYERLVVAPVKVRQAVAKGRLSISAFARMKHAPADVQEGIVGDDPDEDVTVADVRDGLRQAKRTRQPEMNGAIPEEMTVVEQLNEMIGRLRTILNQPLSVREVILVKTIQQIAGEVNHE